MLFKQFELILKYYFLVFIGRNDFCKLISKESIN